MNFNYLPLIAKMSLSGFANFNTFKQSHHLLHIDQSLFIKSLYNNSKQL